MTLERDSSILEFILNNRAAILDEWSRCGVGSKRPDGQARELHMGELMQCIVSSMEPDKYRPNAWTDAAKRYADWRFSLGLEALETLSEQCALREGILRLWIAAQGTSPPDISGLLAFEVAMDNIFREILRRHRERENVARTLFLGTLVHDLKNPVNAILQSMQLLPMLGRLDEKQAHLVQQISNSAHNISELASKLIDMVRIRLGQGITIETAAMDLGTAACATINEIRAAHAARAIKLTTEGDLNGFWDLIRMKEVISNLIGNAVQYSPPDTAVEVVVRQETDGVILSVHNAGPPIPKEVLPYIFDPMTRGTAPHAGVEKSNLGLGLFIAREVIQAHRGTIDVASNGAGTTFIVHLPKAMASGVASVPSIH